MRVSVREEAGRAAIEVQVLSPLGSEQARRLAARIQVLGGRVWGYPSATSTERRLVSVSEVALFEVVAGRTLVRLADGAVLESAQRLCELEAALPDEAFVRVSRQAIVNFDAVRSIRPELNGRLDLELEGGWRTLVTRSYVPAVRALLGMTEGSGK